MTRNANHTPVAIPLRRATSKYRHCWLLALLPVLMPTASAKPVGNGCCSAEGATDAYLTAMANMKKREEAPEYQAELKATTAAFEKLNALGGGWHNLKNLSEEEQGLIKKKVKSGLTMSK